MLSTTIYTATSTVIKETERDVKFEYMYTLSQTDLEKDFDHAEKATIKKLNKEILNNDMEVSVMGIESNSEFSLMIFLQKQMKYTFPLLLLINIMLKLEMNLF